ncbi:MAG: hypothetical protein K9I99_13720 [Melioribacteraceae bacterium]|nr:hypothetical protein [Melioribacteraceae bacterium]
MAQQAVIKHWGRSCYSRLGSLVIVHYTFIVKQLRKPPLLIHATVVPDPEKKTT